MNPVLFTHLLSIACFVQLHFSHEFPHFKTEPRLWSVKAQSSAREFAAADDGASASLRPEDTGARVSVHHEVSEAPLMSEEWAPITEYQPHTPVAPSDGSKQDLENNEYSKMREDEECFYKLFFAHLRNLLCESPSSSCPAPQTYGPASSEAAMEAWLRGKESEASKFADLRNALAGIIRDRKAMPTVDEWNLASEGLSNALGARFGPQDTTPLPVQDLLRHTLPDVHLMIHLHSAMLVVTKPLMRTRFYECIVDAIQSIFESESAKHYDQLADRIKTAFWTVRARIIQAPTDDQWGESFDEMLMEIVGRVDSAFRKKFAKICQEEFLTQQSLDLRARKAKYESYQNWN